MSDTQGGNRAAIEVWSPRRVFNLPLSEFFFVVDLRDAAAFAAGRLLSAHNLTPAAVGELGSDDLDAAAKKRVIDWATQVIMDWGAEYPTLVVYDANSDPDPVSLDGLSPLASLVVNVLAKSAHGLVRSSPSHPPLVVFMAGGYEAFASQYEMMIVTSPNDEVLMTPGHVTDDLFLGAAVHSKSRAVIDGLGITHIANVAKELPNVFEDEDGYTYMKSFLDDAIGQDMTGAIETVIPFLLDARDSGARSMIHCAQGRSRSATLAAAYVMVTMGVGADAALAHVHEARSAAGPNDGFVEQLHAFEDSDLLVTLRARAAH